MVDNIDVAIMMKLNDLTDRYGLKAYDFVAVLRQPPDGSGPVLAFETVGNERTEAKLNEMLRALGVDSDGLLKGGDKEIIDAIDDALQHAPKPRHRH